MINRASLLLKRRYWQFLSLKRIMPIRSALKYVITSHPQDDPTIVEEIRINWMPYSFFVRPSSSDLHCLEQVLAHEEYRIPFRVSPRIIVDAGANIGAASIYFANRYPEAKIYALEPEESNFKLLVQNCLNLDNIVPIKAALWYKNEPVSISDPAVEKWAFTVVDCRRNNEVRGITLDQLMKEYNIEFVDILKLDVEGTEKDIFSNAVPWLDSVSIIAAELHDRIKEGCSSSFYGALHNRKFSQEVRGENVIVCLNNRM